MSRAEPRLSRHVLLPEKKSRPPDLLLLPVSLRLHTRLLSVVPACDVATGGVAPAGVWVGRVERIGADESALGRDRDIERRRPTTPGILLDGGLVPARGPDQDVGTAGEQERECRSQLVHAQRPPRFAPISVAPIALGIVQTSMRTGERNES